MIITIPILLIIATSSSFGNPSTNPVAANHTAHSVTRRVYPPRYPTLHSGLHLSFRLDPHTHTHTGDYFVDSILRERQYKEIATCF